MKPQASFPISRQTAAALLAWITVSACAGAGNGPTPAETIAPYGPSGGGLHMVKNLPPPLNTQDGSEILISPDDVLEVDVFAVDDLDRTVQVDASGRVSLPLIGTVTAQGKSIRLLEQEIEGRYGAQYLQSPDVAIFLKESARQRVTVDGEVTKAGLYPVSSNATLMDAIAQAGGMRDIADAGKVYVYREVGDGRKLVANYNLAQIRSGKAHNPRIFGGDVIIVFTSQSKVAMNNLKEALGMASNAARVAVLP
jgi:polysaccharide export outer membrane protein